MIQIPKPPPLSGKNVAEQLETIRSYLTTVVEQLNWVLCNIETSIESIKGNTDKPSVVQSTPPKCIAQVAQVNGWDITFYRDNTCDMEKVLLVTPFSGFYNTINGVPTYVSDEIQDTLPVHVLNGVVSGEDRTENRPISGSVSQDGAFVSYVLKSRSEFYGSKQHEVYIKVSGKISGLSAISLMNGGDQNE